MKALLMAITCFLAFTGLLTDRPGLIASASVLLGGTFAAIDLARTRSGGLTVLTFFAMSIAAGGIGEWMVIKGVAAGNLGLQKYGLPEYYVRALFLNYTGAGLLLIGGMLAQQACRGGTGSLLPMVEYRPKNPHVTLLVTLALSVVAWLAVRRGLIPNLGKLSALLVFFPYMGVLLIARWGYWSRDRRFTVLAFGLACYLSYWALLNELLRQTVVLPWVAFAVGAWVASPVKRTLVSVPFVSMYVLLLLFMSFFPIMAMVRQERIYGSARVPRMLEIRQEQEALANDDVPMQTPLTRIANVNKLSQILHLVDINGYYWGSSMAYYAYAFIPRVIWHNKPLVKQGGWFAFEIGEGKRVGADNYSNAINMTIPGELYLNFGWIGTIAGCIGVGFIVMLFWQSTAFWDSPLNIPGSLLAFLLIKRAMEFMGPDMQTLVGHVATYLALLAITVLARRLWPVPQNSATLAAYPLAPPPPHATTVPYDL